ncbi:MAG: hypothetical protein NC342_01450 [Pseudoflavonifractor sp.]|nr:hypothetical protein [Alloprevotella sp.]MCM1116190.1 hypothetical protein [Pseudoflavonifractor sp.]
MPKVQYDNQAIIGRIRHLISQLKIRQGAFASRIGIDGGNLSKVLSGQLAVSSSLVNRIVADLGVSKRWLVDGEGIPFDSHACNTGLFGGDAAVDRAMLPGLPIYDVDVTAGTQELSMMLTADRVIGRIDLPNLNPEDILVRVSGDSMTPVIKDGAYVAVRPVSDPKYIFWGQIYVIVMDDYRMVKFLRRHPDDSGMVVLHSANPAYDDMDVARDDLRRLFFVDAIFNYEIRL